MSTLSLSAQKVQDALKNLGIASQVIELPATTRTAQEAANTIGCRVEQIAKSIIFRGKSSGKAILVIAGGANRVNEKIIQTVAGEPIGKADPDFVREKTGFVIGGVPPVGHATPLEIYIDEDLLKLEEIWAAAGTPFAVFKLTPDDLQRFGAGKILAIKSI